MAIAPEFIVRLKGRDYPTYPGVLDAATKAGLRSLTTRVLQIPDASNNHVAVVLARAEFEDGRVFEDVGDASPANCSVQIATAALRMASTRAKGRVLRDSINVGQTMFEELPDLNGESDAPIPTEHAPRATPQRPAPANPQPQSDADRDLPAGASDGADGRVVAKPAAGQIPDRPHCSAKGCEKALTQMQASESLRQFQRLLCREHVAAMAKKIAANPAV